MGLKNLPSFSCFEVRWKTAHWVAFVWSRSMWLVQFLLQVSLLSVFGKKHKNAKEHSISFFFLVSILDFNFKKKTKHIYIFLVLTILLYVSHVQNTAFVSLMC